MLKCVCVVGEGRGDVPGKHTYHWLSVQIRKGDTRRGGGGGVAGKKEAEVSGSEPYRFLGCSS